MGYLVPPLKSAPGGIRSLTWALKPPGTGTLYLWTIGCDLSTITSATTLLSSQTKSNVVFCKNKKAKKKINKVNIIFLIVIILFNIIIYNNFNKEN